MPLLQLLWWLRVGVLVKRWPLLGVGGMPPKAKKPTAAEAKAKASAEKALRTQLKIKTVTNLKAAAVSLGAKKAGSSMVDNEPRRLHVAPEHSLRISTRLSQAHFAAWSRT